MNNSYGNFLIELKRIFNEHSKLLNEFGRSINQFIIKNNEIIQLIDNNEYNKYDNLKYHLKLYDEMYNEIFSNNSYRNIKNEIQQSLNNLQHYKNIDSFNTEHMFMDYRESQNPDESFYKTINDFSDLKKENSSGKIKEIIPFLFSKSFFKKSVFPLILLVILFLSDKYFFEKDFKFKRLFDFLNSNFADPLNFG